MFFYVIFAYLTYRTLFTFPVFSNRSTAIGSGFVRAITKCVISYSDRTHLICPQYRSDRHKLMMDIQPSITGKVENFDKSPADAAVRELREELNIVVDKSKLQFVYDGWSDDIHTNRVRTYVLNLDHAHHLIHCTNKQDDDSDIDSVQIVVVGSEETVNRVAFIAVRSHTGADKIGALVITPITSFLNVDRNKIEFSMWNGESMSVFESEFK